LPHWAAIALVAHRALIPAAHKKDLKTGTYLSIGRKVIMFKEYASCAGRQRKNPASRCKTARASYCILEKFRRCGTEISLRRRKSARFIWQF
jgi:hypothetical protein